MPKVTCSHCGEESDSREMQVCDSCSKYYCSECMERGGKCKDCSAKITMNKSL